MIPFRHGRALQLKVEEDAVVVIAGVHGNRTEPLLVTARLRIPVRHLAKVREALQSFETAPPSP